MGRWEPDARGRLSQAAMDLYSERGFDQTTVTQIAERAGLTERTFFRHFADKREVLFAGSEMLEQAVTETLEHAPENLSAMQAIGLALQSLAPFFAGRHAFAKRRQAVIAANPELQEREHKKMASLSGAMAAALQRRGEKNSTAALAAEMGTAVFKIAFEQWLRDPQERSIADHIDACLAELKSVV